MPFSIKLGNFLYNNAFSIYKPMYAAFKNKQDAFEIELLKKHIRKDDTVLDIGANIGFYATLLSSIVGENGIVHCFEPDKTNFDHLISAASGMRNIITNNKAVGPRTEKLKIYTSKHLNVDHRTYKPDEYGEEMEVQAVSIDDYLRDDLRVDFIKMDIQGFELQAVFGMEKTIATNKNIKMISEFWPYGLRKAGSSVVEYFSLLQKSGFACYLLERTSLRELTACNVQLLDTLGEERYFNIFATRNDA